MQTTWDQLQRFFIFSLGMLTAVIGSSLYAADELEVQFKQIAKEVVQNLRSENAKAVGVLKFSVRVGDGSFPSSLGTLNMRLAEKLEIALVMANSAQESQAANQVGVIRSASDVADKIPNANHLNTEGRKLLFTREYPLAWMMQGKDKAIPDALIVGAAQLSSDLRKMEVELMMVKRQDASIKPIASLSVATDLEDLIDSGESFTTRGLFDDGSILDTDKKVELVAKKSTVVREETLAKNSPQPSTLHPLASNSDSPIKFEVLYGNQPQPIEFRNGAAFIKEPREGQKVMLVVRRKQGDNKRYGILIRVNGENTLFRERTPDLRSALWILEPNLKEFAVQGYQIDKGARQEFKVLSDRESEKRAVNYGRDVGMISVVVFQEMGRTPPTLDEDQLDLAVQSQATLPKTPASSRGQLGKSLFDQLLAQDSTRGLIAEGETKASAINTVTFQRDPTPVMATSIRYYNPR